MEEIHVTFVLSLHIRFHPSLIKIICLLYLFSSAIHLTSNYIPLWGHVSILVFDRPNSNEPSKALGVLKRAVVRLVNIFNSRAYDWTVKDK